MTKLKQAVDNNKKIIIRAFSVTPTIEKTIHEALELILVKYNCASLLTPIYTCLKELVINAVKANFKNIYFENYAPKNKSDEVIDYKMALKLFKHEMSHNNAHYLRKLAIQNKKQAEIIFETEDDILYIYVTNPVPMTDTEQQNVQKKLRDASKYNDITEYFLQVENDPNKEGAGLGLILISIMLKSLGAEDKLRIISYDDRTVASFNIHLSQKTVERFRTSRD